MAAHRRNPAELPIPRKSLKLYCPNHESLQDVSFVTKRDGVDVAVLECLCARTRHLDTDKISLEHAWSPEGQKLFPGDKQRTLIDATIDNYRRETFYK
jgi:hypothetical protein